LETTPAILLRKIKLTESSLIITWFTEAHGKLKTVAKGARRPKSPFAGRLDLFFAAEINFSRSRRSELHILREVVVRDPREGLRQDYLRTRLAAHFVELIEMTTEFEHPVPELYDLLRRALDYLDKNPPTRRAMLHFENQLSRLLGVTGSNNADADPAQAIVRLAGQLPPDRAKLLKSLPRPAEKSP
jgi:DNA repair protein RecO (recombination protein O)